MTLSLSFPNLKLTALSLAQGLGITSAVISVNVSGLAGAHLCSTPHLATIPYGLQFAATIGAAMPIAWLMERFGRRVVFVGGAGAGFLGGIAGMFAIDSTSFLLLCLSHILLGAQLATVNLYRFAAADIADEKNRSSALSLVLFGGVFAALVGPWVARNAWLYLPSSMFGAAYLSISLVALGCAALIATIKIPPPANIHKATHLRMGELAHNRPFLLAVTAGALVYGFMNMMMVASSLEMAGHGYEFNLVSYLIQAHVLAMFVPALFTGRFIKRLGVNMVLAVGCILMLASGIAGLYVSPSGFALSLLFLGLGWNALYTAGSYLAMNSLEPRWLYRGQGVNEMCVAVMATVGAFGAAFFLAELSWPGLNILMMAVMTALLAAIIRERYVARLTIPHIIAKTEG
jgi:MFS family permease